MGVQVGVHMGVHFEHGVFTRFFGLNNASDFRNNPQKNPPVHSYINFSETLKPVTLKSEHPWYIISSVVIAQ